MEAVKAVRAGEDGRAIELLDNSEQAIEEVVGTFDEPSTVMLLLLYVRASGTSLGDDIRSCLR
jgi:hypothetical protein